MTPQEARAIAQMGYVFTFPLVANYGAMYVTSLDVASPSYSGGFGRWSPPASLVARGLAGATRARLTWVDTSASWSTSKQNGSTIEWFDLWGHTSDDREANAVLGGVRYEDDGAEAPPPLTPTSPLRRRTWFPWRPDVLTGDEFWRCADFVLSLVDVERIDAPLLERLAAIGVGVDRHGSERCFDAPTSAAIGWGMDDALSALLRTPLTTPTSSRSFEELDRDYYSRALDALGRLNAFDALP